MIGLSQALTRLPQKVAATDAPPIPPAGAIIQRRWTPRDEPRRLGSLES